jgi:hypothetical protein
VHAQKPSVQFPVGPHCESTAQVPHVPETHASPPPHSLLAVHALQTPLTHASPPAVPSGPVDWLQSANVEQAPHAPFLHTSPFRQPAGGLQPAFGLFGAQTPLGHVSPDAQSLSFEHVHCTEVWVAMHVAFGPHWLSEVHVWQVPPAQTSPDSH